MDDLESCKELTKKLLAWDFFPKQVKTFMESLLKPIDQKLEKKEYTPSTWKEAMNTLWETVNKDAVAKKRTKKVYDWFQLQIQPKKSLDRIKSFNLDPRILWHLKDGDSNEFTFKIGEKRYPCTRHQAAFISELARNLMERYPNHRMLKLRIKDDGNLFAHLMTLVQTGTLDFGSVTNIDAFLDLVEVLHCPNDLVQPLIAYKFGQTCISANNVFDRIEEKQKLGVSIEDEVDFLALHMDDIFLENLPQSLRQFTGLGVEICMSIVSNPNLYVKKQDNLLAMIQACGEEFRYLLEKVNYVLVSGNQMKKFLYVFDPETMTQGTWDALRQRFECEVKPGAAAADASATEIPWTGENFKGIFASLRTQCGGNPHVQGKIEITASSNGINKCHQIVDYGWGQSWQTDTNQRGEAFVTFNFKTMKVSVSGYTIKSGNGVGQPVSWCIEVSDTGDNESWTTIDSRNTRDITQNFAIAHFECEKPDSSFYQYVRLRQTGPNAKGSSFLYISELEFFGKITACMDPSKAAEPGSTSPGTGTSASGTSTSATRTSTSASGTSGFTSSTSSMPPSSAFGSSAGGFGSRGGGLRSAGGFGRPLHSWEFE